MRKIVIFICLVNAFLFAAAQDAPEGLFIASKAPDFKGKNQNGTEVHLKDSLKKGKVVLVFYRGYWSPECNKELKRLQDSLSMIIDKNARVIAITPEKPENILKTIEKTAATYSIVFDDKLKIMKSYDVAFEVPENTLTRYHNTGIDIEVNNGTNGKFLPVPAVYIIDKESNITYRFFEMDYKKRPSVKEILKNL